MSLALFYIWTRLAPNFYLADIPHMWTVDPATVAEK
jgi:hypothetical protein